MKKIILRTAFILMILIASCDEDNEVTSLHGTYKGTFLRSDPLAFLPISNVTLTFTNNGFSGNSDMQKYPAICRGEYSLKRNKIDFENQCAWTAEFDWSYILSGSFDIAKDKNKIVMTRHYDENRYDQYILEQQ